MPKHANTDQYIADCTASVAPLMSELRAFIHDQMPGATEGMEYGVPVFLNAHGVSVIYLFGAKDHVNFGFLKAAALDDTDGVLEGSGAPSKHIKIAPDDAISTGLLQGFITQCKGLTP